MQDVNAQIATTLVLHGVKPNGKTFSKTTQDWGELTEAQYHLIEKTVAAALLELGDAKHNPK